MKSIFAFILFAICFPSFGFSQAYIKVMQYRPTGEFGFATKKSIALELGEIHDFEGITRTRFYGNLTFLQPRLESFPAVGYVAENQKTTFMPGTQRFKTMLNLAFGVGLDLSPESVNFGNIRPYVGIDIVPGFHARYVITDIPGISNISEFDVAPFIGFKGRVGVQYTFKYSGIFLDIERNYSLILGYAYMNFNTIGIGFFHEF